MDNSSYAPIGQVNFELFSSFDSIATDQMIDIKVIDEWVTWREDATNCAFLNFKPTVDTLSTTQLIIRAVDTIKNSLIEGHSILIAVSGGKDSHCTLLVFMLAAMELVREGRRHLIQPCAVLNSNTLIEMPEAHNLAVDSLKQVEIFAQKNDLPLTVVMASPSIQSSWFGKILGGRGIPVFTNASTRDCAIDWKIEAGIRAVNKWIRSLGKNVTEFRKRNLITLIGSRLDESVKRASSLKRLGGDDQTIMRNAKGEGFLYPVYYFTEEMIWSTLMRAGQEGQTLPAPLKNYDDLFEFYKDAAGSDCHIVSAVDENGNSLVDSGGTIGGACGTRSGCILCTAVKDDKSALGLIASDEQKFGYLRNLNRIQQVLSKSQYNWNLRGAVGRTLYSNGYCEIKHDTFGIEFLTRLLKGLITADYLEQQRAKKMELDLIHGHIEDSPRNRKMAKPMFHLITQEILIYLEFIWSLHGFAHKPFLAFEAWDQVYNLGELELFEDLEDLERSPSSRSSKFYLKVCSKDKFWDEGRYVYGQHVKPLNYGLENSSSLAPEEEDEDLLMDAAYFAADIGMTADPSLCANASTNVYDGHTATDVKLCGAEADSRSIQIDTTYFDEFLADINFRLKNNYRTTPLETAKVLLRVGLVSIPKQHMIERHYQAVRGQVLYHNNLSSNRTLEQVHLDALAGKYTLRSHIDLNMHDSRGKLKVKSKKKSNFKQNAHTNKILGTHDLNLTLF